MSAMSVLVAAGIVAGNIPAVGRRRCAARLDTLRPAHPGRPRRRSPVVRWRAAARRRSARREVARRVVDELPDVVGLLRVASSAGSTVPQALAAVAAACDGPVADGLAGVMERAATGERLIDALAALDELGPSARPLVDALVASERDGAALVPALDRVGVEVRAERRVRAERAARSLSVQLLFPLVCCVLPAFALLTVVPVVVRALSALAP